MVTARVKDRSGCVLMKTEVKRTNKKSVCAIVFDVFSFFCLSEGPQTRADASLKLFVSTCVCETGKLLSPGLAPSRKTSATVLRNTSRLTQGQ